MTIKSIDALDRAGTVLADDFLDSLERYALTDCDDALYDLVDNLTLRTCYADEVKLKALLYRVQKQLEANR